MSDYQPVDGPLKWFGGKAYLAKRIVALMPEHKHYVEPYAGGLSVLLEKDPNGVSEVVNDLNCDLATFWEVLREESFFSEFRRKCEATAFCEATWNEAEDILQSRVLREVVSVAWAFFVRCRQSRAGQFKDFATLSRTRVRRGMNEQASAWLTCIEGLPAVHARLKRVVILNRDALDVIRQQDGWQTLFYLDPPYLHETRTSKSVYAHEMTTEQHIELLDLLATIEGRFMLSGYPSELYGDAARRHGWAHVDFDIANHASGSKTKTRETERVWANFPLA